jgi:type IV secretory pathway ATPase VirB11/archaellum biosynthesis ATPase
MDEAVIRAHVYAINACNQRGGRMLSLVDLIEAGTVDLSLAAYLAVAMRAGASLLVGARPGGAGKTAVMCALLNFLPDRTTIRAVDSRAVLAEGGRDAHPGNTCYLAHEISNAHYYAYVWGSEARAFFRLAAQGYIVASNLHADTLEETRDQLCRENGVARAHLDAVTLKLYLRVERTGGWAMRRRVSSVYQSDGTGDRLLWLSQIFRWW